MTMRLSVLDQSPVSEGATPADALRSSVELAQEADRLGFLRYWVAEHHNSSTFAGTAPEILAATLLMCTRRLRVGSGGVLLPRYEALKVAEVFQVLAALHPGRVDLGIGRAGGPAQRFPEQLAALRRYLGALPPGAEQPVLWLLGAGGESARLAADLGTSFCFAHFLAPELAAAALRTYRSEPAGPLPGPHAGSALAVRLVVAGTAAEAADLARCFLLWRSRKDLGHDEAFPSIGTARRHRWTTAEDARAAANSEALIAGTPEQVQAELTALAAAHLVDEIVVNTLTHDPADRLASYRLLAETVAVGV
jgi:luciferase family oxidoreductase group 1